MQAILRIHGPYLRSATTDVAGRPLLVRQLQWLRDAGIKKVAVGLDPRLSVLILQRATRLDAALAANVMWVADDGRETDAAFLKRVGFDLTGPVLSVPGNVLSGVDVAHFASGTSTSLRVLLESTKPIPVGPARPSRFGADEEPYIDILYGGAAPLDVARAAAWGSRVATVRDGLALGVLALLRRLPGASGDSISTIQIHAAEREAGVWLARGANVEAGVRLVAPVLLGPDTLVCAGASVGEGSVLARASVVERGAHVIGSFISEGMIVGEGLVVRGQCADERVLVDLESGARAPLADRLLLDRRVRRSFQALSVTQFTQPAVKAS